jgi:hypothetical protein
MSGNELCLAWPSANSHAFIDAILSPLLLNKQAQIKPLPKGLEQEHPKVRHEVASHTVVRVVEQNPHDSSLLESF